MDEFRFRNWSVYRDAKEIVNLVFSLTAKFPQQFRFSLGDQLNRAATSIVLNIAEGAGKLSDQELNRFFNIATGSLNETFAGLEIACENDLLPKKELIDLEKRLLNIGKQIGGFRKKLSLSSSKVYSIKL